MSWSRASVTTSRESRCIVFRQIARQPHFAWPVYDTTPLYDRTSLGGLESDVRTVSEAWFDHESHHSVEEFVCVLPLAYFRFGAHDCYGRSTRYEMATLFRVFVLKELHDGSTKSHSLDTSGTTLNSAIN